MSDDGPAGYGVFIDPAADEEIAEAHDWYEHKVPGLGAEFIRALDAALAAIERNPAGFPIVYEAGLLSRQS